MLRTISLRSSFLAAVVAVTGSFSAWAGDAALISALDGDKLCTATLESATWTPMLGETIPEKTGLEIGPRSTVNLVHFGTNREVTLPEGSRVIVLMQSIEGLATDTKQATLENMPQGLDLEARHQQQVGAVNMQHTAQSPARKTAPGGSLRSSTPPSSSGAGESAMPSLPPAAPAPAPVSMPVPEERPSPVSEEKPSMASTFEGQKDEMSTRGGTSFMKGNDIDDLMSGNADTNLPQGEVASTLGKQKREREAEQAMAIQARTILIAIPAEKLNITIGKLDTIFIAQAVKAGKSPAFSSIEIPEKPGISTGTWILIDIELPADVSTAAVILNGKNKHSTSLGVEFSSKADISVSSAVRSEFQGFPAQAAAIWINLLNRGAVSPEIAAAHLRRLSPAIAAKLR
ncbi:MAG TPA: hypothetical protein PKM25_07565 [Candidatus Ozemobacteraceae bacterium]|nr:hypothetical protein [Candidatus Ozemobacteraceae bacterium]